MNNLKNLDRVLDSFQTQHISYIIGAGASAGIMPTTSKLKEKTVNYWKDMDSYPVEATRHHAAYERLIGNPYDNYGNDLISSLLDLMPNNSAELIAYYHLSPILTTQTPSQYYIFNFVVRPSVFFNFNLDGLLSYFCRGHVIFEPHGRTKPNLSADNETASVIRTLVEHGIRHPALDNVVLLRPEPSDITNCQEHLRFANLVKFSKYLTIIGYSFSKYMGQLDDIESFLFLMERVKHYRLKVIIIDPNPYEISELIGNSTGTTSIYPFPVYWDVFSKIVVSVLIENKISHISKLHSYKTLIIKKYCELSETSGRE